MTNDEIRDLIIQVISSWQVIAITLIILIYISLVNYVCQTKRRKRASATVKKKEKKVKPAAAPKDDAVDDSALGMEE